MKIVIIGYGPAAIKAIEAITAYKAVSHRDVDSITVVSAELIAPYSPMFLVDYLTGELVEEEILLEENHGLSVERLLGDKVIRVEDNKNQVILESGRELGYNKLLIASGAVPFKPSIKGIDKEGVYFFNRVDDAKRLSRQVSSAKNIIIIGAGATGVEAAVALNKIGKKVLVVEQLTQILPQMLDRELAKYMERKLADSGVIFLLGNGVSEIAGNGWATGVVVGNKEIMGDLILIIVGVKPNIDFLKSSNVKVNKGILVNEKMQTNVPNIYAAGDVAESIDLYGGYELVLSWYNAIDQGWSAGCNLIGIENTCKASPGLVVLKGTEPPVISVGRKFGENGYKTLSYSDKQRGICEKVFLKNNRIDCYQTIGISDKVGLMYGYIKERKDINNIRGMFFDNYRPVNFVA